MTGARGDALEWALALALAPGERHALRQRPLPEGIEALLQIAAGSHGSALQAALARTGESEAELVEAVRFYLREVLFHAGADAYRTLGLNHEAGPEQIKGHHRLLQQWLHPDRHTSDWDAIFAGRVNAAWNALRTAQRRAAYDTQLPAVIAAASMTTRWVAPHVLSAAPIAAETSAARWRRRAPVMALFAACGVLGIVAVRDSVREPDSGYGTVAIEPKSSAPAVALQLPHAIEPGVTGNRLGSRHAAPAGRLAAIATPVPGRVEPPVPVEPLAGDAASMAPIAAPTDVVPNPPPRGNVVLATAPSSTAAPVPAAAAMALSPEVGAHPFETPARSSLGALVRTGEVREPPTLPAKPNEMAPPVAAAASAERVQQAQRTGRQLIAFMAGLGTALPPIWDSLAAQQRAQRLRETLHASGTSRAGEPQWRVDHEDAALQATFGEGRRFRAQLVWRDQRWLVSGVALE